MEEVEDAILSPGCASRSLTSRLVLACRPRPSAGACRQTRVAATAPSLHDTATMTLVAVAVAVAAAAAAVVVAVAVAETLAVISIVEVVVTMETTARAANSPRRPDFPSAWAASRTACPTFPLDSIRTRGQETGTKKVFVR